MKEFEAKVRLNEENGGKTGELDIMAPPPFDKGYFNGVTFGITFKDPVFEADKKSGWIPCSERLPEEGEKVYLVTIDYGDGLSCVAPRFFWDEKRLWNEAEEYITAWMPIPRPYKQEDEHGS